MNRAKNLNHKRRHPYADTPQFQQAKPWQPWIVDLSVERDLVQGVTFVYFIRAGDDGPIKIGIAAEPEKRLAALQTSNAHDLKLLHTFRGGPAAESKLHAKFRKSRLRGEWFKPTEDLLEYIASEPTGVALGREEQEAA